VIEVLIKRFLFFQENAPKGSLMANSKLIRNLIVICICFIVPPVFSCDDDNDNSSGAAAGVSGTDGVGTGSGTNGTAGTQGAITGTDSATAGGSTETDASGPLGGGAADATVTAIPKPLPLDYSDEALWMCKPGAANNPCESNADVTEILADNSLGDPVTVEVKTDAAFDCFYIYPTVDIASAGGNHLDLTDNIAAQTRARTLISRFSSICRVYAPYYRQMTLGSYSDPQYQEYFDIAYADVTNAFEYYLQNENNGRDLVLIGHSQGSHMLTRVLKERFDGDQAMTDKLLSALLTGTSEVFVPIGEVIGGTFTNLPLCTIEGQTGCIVVYNSVSGPPSGLAAGRAQPPEGQEVACVNPANLSGGKAHLSAYVTAEYLAKLPTGVTTPFAFYPEFYTGECIREGTIHAFLVEVSPVDANDQRLNPYDFTTVAALMGAITSLHMIDMELVQGDLINLISKQAESR
jgi:hypothetical protein